MTREASALHLKPEKGETELIGESRQEVYFIVDNKMLNQMH